VTAAVKGGQLSHIAHLFIIRYEGDGMGTGHGHMQCVVVEVPEGLGGETPSLGEVIGWYL